MRENIGILWVEDSKSYYAEAKDILEMHASDRGIKINYRYVEDASCLFEELEKQVQGFQIYDICFIDYALSMPNGKTGENIIRELRQKKVGTDILFYSSENISTIRETIKQDLSSFEGVYVADRDSFEDKSKLLLNKNSKKLYSINNIRGLLMNETSENDYIMKSYILKEFATLSDEQKIEITNLIKQNVIDNYTFIEKSANKIIEKIEKDNILEANKILNIINDLLHLEDRYRIFEKIIKFKSNDIMESGKIDNYLNKLVKLRNKLAHRKLEICNSYKYVLHYNDIDDYERKHCCTECSDNCGHTENNKVCIEDWDKLKKELVEFGQIVSFYKNDKGGNIGKSGFMFRTEAGC